MGEFLINVISRLSIFLRKYWFVLLEPHCQGTFNQDITIYKSAGTFLEFTFDDVSLQYLGFNLVFIYKLVINFQKNEKIIVWKISMSTEKKTSGFLNEGT